MNIKNKQIQKILIPVLIVVAVFGLWILKTSNNKAEGSLPVISSTKLPEHLKGADFSLEVTTAIDFATLAKYGIPAIIDYGSNSCIPCKAMAPALKKLNKEMLGKAFVKFADVWAYRSAADNVPVQVIPTQIFIRHDGSPFVPSDELAAEIGFILYNDTRGGDHIFTLHQGGLTEEQMRKILKEMGVV